MDLRDSQSLISSYIFIELTALETFFFSFNILYFTVTYAVPLLVMLLCYIQMSRVRAEIFSLASQTFSMDCVQVLWGNQSIGEENVSTIKSRKTKQKVLHFGLN